MESFLHGSLTAACCTLSEITGRQSHQIIVRDITSNSDSTVTVSFTARIKGKESSSYVRIPDVDSETLQFGDCYIAPKTFMHKQKYIKTVRLLHTERAYSLWHKQTTLDAWSRDCA